ncbi:unnamed protein product [Aphis gossypii]|uniref:Uncharacterized protein n=1 Tax=Aphis gossypii TaxID=80765 RepID=A0A9P0J939_APHGO|nr:unnamed protein product [Aphis gossypii]
MVPSSIQWTMNPSVHILVYPLSKYVISPVNKTPGTTVKRLIQSRKTTATPISCRKTSALCLPENCSNHQYQLSKQYRRMQTYSSKRSPYYRSKRSKLRCEKRYRSRDMCSGLGSFHYQGKQEQDRNDEPDVNMESEDHQGEEEEEKEEEEEVEVEDCDYDGDDDNVNDDDYDDDNKYDDEEDDNGDEFKDLVLGRKRKPLDNVIRSMPLIGDKENRVTRYSANVVLLAHGNRSLYVLTIQRNQVTSIDSSSFTRHSNHRSSSTSMISYKLPGGQFILTEDEPQNYQKKANNTCTCPDDQQWYSAAINHFITQLTTRSPTTMTIMGQSSDDRSQFVLLGNWYRTQQNDDYKAFLVANGTRCHRHRHSNKNYYPYKPAHVSRRLAGHKRVYAVPDACQLFPGADPTFRLQTPLVKTKTATTKTKTTIITTTITTTYKCKFVPLARLHENSRMYGPVLSSLPAILSR